MSCLRPVSIPVYRLESQTEKFSRNVDGKLSRFALRKLMKVKHFINVPCGHCPACLKKAQQEWAFRIEQEVLDPRVVSALFVTLTYAPKYLPSDRSVHKVDVQNYLKRLRINLERAGFTRHHTRYYACGEYGDLYNRPHYHLILTFRQSVDWSLIQSSWSRGIVDIAQFTPARAGYVAKYSMKQFGISYKGLIPPFRLCSKGLGKFFLRFHSGSSIGYASSFMNITGHVVPLHRYYIDKLYPHYKRSYYTIDSPLGNKLRFSHREYVPSSARQNYLLLAQRRYDDFVNIESSKNAFGHLGFLRAQKDSQLGKLSFSSFSLIEKQLLK